MAKRKQQRRPGCKKIAGKWVCPPQKKARRRAAVAAVVPRGHVAYQDWWDDPTADSAVEIEADQSENLWWQKEHMPYMAWRDAEAAALDDAKMRTGKYVLDPQELKDLLDTAPLGSEDDVFPPKALLEESIAQAMSHRFNESIYDARMNTRAYGNAASEGFRRQEACARAAWSALPGPNFLSKSAGCTDTLTLAARTYWGTRFRENAYALELGVADLSRPSGPRNYRGPRHDPIAKKLLIEKARTGRTLMQILKCCLGDG